MSRRNDIVPTTSQQLGVSNLALLVRGARLHCPVCRGGGLFEGFGRLPDRCPHCSFRFERVDGHWMGSLGLNTIVSFATTFVVLMVAVLLTMPRIPTIPVIAAGAGSAVLVPLLFFPASKTLWTAIDLVMRPLTEAESVEVLLHQVGGGAAGDAGDQEAANDNRPSP